MTETIPTTKICTKCKIDKELHLFNKDLRKKDSRCSKCKACEKLYYILNKEKISNTQKIYYEKNKDDCRSVKNIYYQNNKEKIYIKKREYEKSEKGIAVNRNKQYKRRSITRQGDVTSNQIVQLQHNAKLCYWCNQPLKNKVIHIDHYIPLSKGGEHTLSNLVVSCDKCNRTKCSKDPIVFANSIGKLF